MQRWQEEYEWKRRTEEAAQLLWTRNSAEVQLRREQVDRTGNCSCSHHYAVHVIQGGSCQRFGCPCRGFISETGETSDEAGKSVDGGEKGAGV